MRIIRTVLFDREETAALDRANNLIDIAFPLDTDPLVQRTREARERAVPADHQIRNALRGLRSPFDPITHPRLVFAEKALVALVERIEVESDVAHWLGLAGDPEHPQTRQMAEVLATERGRQRRAAQEALDLIRAALEHVTVEDDPREVRREETDEEEQFE